jgi:hypothetical protein
LTWDRGKEMADHVQFTIDTGVQVYFCDPRSPWQWATSENSNGLLRSVFPKGTDLSVADPASLERVAAELNGRPRRTLGWLTPSEMFAGRCVARLRPPTLGRTRIRRLPVSQASALAATNRSVPRIRQPGAAYVRAIRSAEA